MSTNPVLIMQGAAIRRLDLGAPAMRYAIALAYAIAFLPVYDQLSTWWYYFGFTFRAPGNIYALICVLVAAPALTLPRTARNFFDFAVILLYFLMFIPCMIVPVLQGRLPTGQIVTLFGLTLLSCLAFNFMARRDVREWPRLKVTARFFWTAVVLLYVACVLVIYFVLGDALTFASSDTVYDQRFAVSATVGGSFGGVIVAYVINLFQNAINPFLLATGFVRRQWHWFALGAAGQLLAFSTLALRSILISPLFIVLIVLLFDRNSRLYAHRFGLSVSAGLAFCLIFIWDYVPTRGLFDQLVTLISLRTLYISGMTFGVYADFFTIFPNTYFSHINLVRLFIDYPYPGYSIGQVVGQYLVPNQAKEILEANANYLASDGIGGIGFLGVPLMTLLSALVLRAMAGVVRALDLRIVCGAMVPFMISLTNNPLFTSLLTGGGGLLIVMLYGLSCTDKDAENRQRLAAPGSRG